MRQEGRAVLTPLPIGTRDEFLNGGGDGLISVELHLRRQALLHAFGARTHKALLSSRAQKVRRALAGLGINEHTMRARDVGFVPSLRGLSSALASDGFTPDELAAIGLLDPAWAGGIVLAWRNWRGQIAGFVGLDLAGDETCWTQMSPRNRAFFGLDVAVHDVNISVRLLLLDRVLDVFLLQESGVACAAAMGGTGDLLTPAHLQLLVDLGIRNATLIPSAREASLGGALAAIRTGAGLASSPELLAVDPAALCPCETPGTLLRERGTRAFWQAVAGRVPGDLFRFLLQPCEV